MNKLIGLTVVLLAGVMVFYSISFTVHESETAIKLRFGRLIETDYGPGIHFKWPTSFVDRVYIFDKRILTLDTRPERALTSEKKNVIVDSFVKWRIIDVTKYFKKTGGDERRAVDFLTQFVKKNMLDAFGKRTVQQVISDQRAEVMQEVLQQVSGSAKDLGVEIVDVRIKRVEFDTDINASVYGRMEKERATVAKQFRSEGEEQSKVIRADAERQREEILADAYAKAQKIRGEGDAKATQIYAKAYNQNAEFYSFYRSINAYKNTFANPDDVLVLEPDSEFFRYFKNPNGK